jgi:hypothetical protein
MKHKTLIIAIILILFIAGCAKETIQAKNEIRVIDDNLNEDNVTEEINQTPETQGPYCGDNACDSNETKCNCAKDCGECEGITGTCEQFACVHNECLIIKEKNCCGNSICETDETASNCNQDCPDYDLGDFPSPFTSNTVIIVGSKGFNTDPVAALTIINAIGSKDAAILDSEISSLNNKNSIIIGGPCQNSWAKEFYGEMEDCNNFMEGKAIIKLFKTGNSYSLLIAGKTAEDTLAAAEKIAKTKLSGNEYIIQ